MLGPRLKEAAEVAASAPGRSADAIFGGIDAVKLRSSMSLFAIAEPGEPTFRQVLERFFGGRRDEATERIVSPPAGADEGPPPG